MNSRLKGCEQLVAIGILEPQRWSRLFLRRAAPAWTGADARPYIVDVGYQCAGCGEWNATTVDESAGSAQTYVEDCQICCKPNLLQVSYDRETEQFVIDAELE
jgi:hypothetical protein